MHAREGKLSLRYFQLQGQRRPDARETVPLRRLPACSRRGYIVQPVFEAQRGTIVPQHGNTFAEHSIAPDGTPIGPTAFGAPHLIEPGPANR